MIFTSGIVNFRIVNKIFTKINKYNRKLFETYRNLCFVIGNIVF